MTIDYKALAAQAAEIVDHTETTQGGDFDKPLIPAGITIGRFIEYVELGVQPQKPYQGTPRPDINQARFTFELLHPKNAREIEVDGKKVTVHDRFSFIEAVKMGEKSRFINLFETMRYGRTDITHFAQMLNDAFVLNFSHNESEKDGKKVTYVNLYSNRKYGIQPPSVTDPITLIATPVPVPAAVSPIKIFLWDLPTKETWDSLHIAGTRTVKDAKGNESQQSKNWLQDKILSAKNFSGSPLEDMLTGSAELTEAVERAEAKPQAAVTPKVAKAKAAPTVVAKTAKEAVKTKAKAAPVAETVDPLKALGL